MENIATKKFVYDHVSSYKGRGRSGASSRNVRVQRASENRQRSRMDEVSKRRRMPLSPLADENAVDKGLITELNEEQNDKPSNPELSRRDRLLKWREEQKQKKGTEPQKKSFVVRHVKYDKEAILFADKMKKATKGLVQLIKPIQYAATKPEKRVTRASARIAKQSSNLVADLKTVKMVEPKSKAAGSDKLHVKEKTEIVQEKAARVTRQSLRTKSSSSGKGTATSQSSKKVAAEPKKQVTTRSQAKKVTEQPPSEIQCPSKLDKQTGQTSPVDEKTAAFENLIFPPLDNIKNTVSFGRGSTEGAARGQPSTGSVTEAQSFAPADFQFTAPNGVNTFTYFSKTFKFQPLSPSSAAEFMFPTSSSSLFSPKTEKPAAQKHAKNAILEDPVAACHLNNELTACKSNQQQQADHEMIEATTETCNVAMEMCDGSEKQQGDNEVVENESTAQAIDGEIPSNDQQKSEATVDMDTGMDSGDILKGQNVGGEQHDATYFRNLVKKETDGLNEICARWEKINAEEQHLSEEVTGQIRTTIGQGQLLIDQRFCQFSGLIDQSEDENAEKQVTVSDLQGFWEMIYFQVEDVNAKFDALKKLKENNWKEEEKKPKKVTKKSKAKKPTAGNDAGKPNNKQGAAKNRIQEMRMAMKAKMAADKDKMRAEKRHQEEEAFVTILTPVKKSKKNDGSEEVVLTPIRRSIRKTPQMRSMLGSNITPVVVTTPKIISENSPGLRLTPDNGNLPNELAITGISVAQVDATREEGEAARGMELQEEAFVTVFTPVKKSKKSDGSEEVVLTPIRRSIRKTPQMRSMLGNNITPVVVTTPKIISENSPGLRLTPDNGNLPNELAITGISAAQVDDTPEEGEAAHGMDLQLEEDEKQCELEQQGAAVLKSACKSTENKSRKSTGKVTFQSPDQESTPECAVHEVAFSPMVTDVPDSAGSDEKRAKKPTPQRFSARKCRSRMGTPYYQQGPRRRVSAVDEDVGREAESSEGRSSSDSESSDAAKAAEHCPGSGLRRSSRKTPSKYRDSTPLEGVSDQAGKTPADVSVKLFHAAEDSTTRETPKHGLEQDVFSKYLCPSSSDEEDCVKEPVVSVHVDENAFEDKATRSEDFAVNEDVNLTPPEEPHNFIRPSITNSEPKTGRTPIHFLRYLSDIDTPSPNSRQITPMPKTTIFVSPSGSSKTPALVDSLGMMSPENVVRRFPAKSAEGSPLLSLAPVAGKESHSPVTPCSQLAAFCLDDSPVDGEKRRDSVFFAPGSTAVIRAQDNLMCFSPVVEAEQEEVSTNL